MAKKFKPKAQSKEDQSFYHPNHTSMMTEQEEKMFYANKKHTMENTNLTHIKKKNTTLPQVTNYKAQQSHKENDEEENIDNLELFNLNQTSAEQITEFINKLIAKNKVTSRNAFDIPLIHLEQMQDFRSSLNENTWKRLSSTLQNDYKIYGYRVDAAHTITYKMVESIARHEAAGQENKIINLNRSFQAGKNKHDTSTNGLLNSFIDSSFNNENISRNKMSVDYTKFIQKNQKLINVLQIETFFGCNPGLQKTKRKFDQQGLKALLLNNIALRNGSQLKLDQHRRYDSKNDRNQIKKQNIQNENNHLNEQYQTLETQMENYFERIFNSVTHQNRMQIEDQAIEQNVFDLIYELNRTECKSNDDEFRKFEKLYRIVSGEEREEKRLLSKKKQVDEKILQVQAQNLKQNIDQEYKGLENRIIRDNNEINNNIQTNEMNLETVIEKPYDELSIQQQQNQTQNSLKKDNVWQVNQGLQNITQNKNDLGFNENDANQMPENQSMIIDQAQQKHPQIIPETISLLNQNQNQQNNTQTDNENHPLIDKNFEMHELNPQRMQQSQSSKQDSKQLNLYTGNFKNIEEYIKIKQQKGKQQKKTKILIDDLTSEQIGKKLFNRNYKKKRHHQSIKYQHLIKQQSQTDQLKNKVDFTKLTKPNTYLKRSLILKKSIQEQRTFSQIKKKIKKKIQQRGKNKQSQECQNVDKRKKSKKTLKLFDLPTYQFQEGDTNFIQPYEEINPYTNQLEFSSIYKDHFPSFVQSSYKIIEEIKRKKLQQQKEMQELQQMQRNQQRLTQQGIVGQNQNFNQVQHPNSQNQHPKDLLNLEEQENDEQQPDISFIGDEMGQFKSKNQVAIRDAKQKVEKIILQMLFNSKVRKTKSKKHKKISFKEIYETYYRKQGFISPALCFLTILHLANEHNLVLEGKQDGTDFKLFLQKQINIAEEMKNNQFSIELEPILEQSQIMNKSMMNSFSSLASLTRQEKNLIQEE